MWQIAYAYDTDLHIIIFYRHYQPWFIHSRLNATETEPTSTGNKLIPRVGNELRALAILALGKLSIQQLDLAKQVVAVIGHELKTSRSSMIRNNAMLALADITVRKTQLVTPYVETMAASLHDTAVLVRRQTIVSLSNLLQQGYLKWNEALFYKYVSSLNDVNREVRTLAEYTLVDMQRSKHEGMFAKYSWVNVARWACGHKNYFVAIPGCIFDCLLYSFN